MTLYSESFPSIIPATTSSDPKAKKRYTNTKFSILSQVSNTLQGKIPALPFLVPAVIARLQSHPKYGSITIVQPGEADLYCARYVKEHGGIVLTGDSDLLVHDLGMDGSVAFLKDLSLGHNMNRRVLSCPLYNIGDIVKRLELPESHGIRSLAYELVQDRHESFLNILRSAKSLERIKRNPASYKEFEREYLALPPDVHPITSTSTSPASPKSSESNGILKSRLRSLDPRISEYVLQFPSIASIAQRPSITPLTSEPLNVFMPFLIDSPTKTSAWEPSTGIRQLAYGLMNLLQPSDQCVESVLEHRRQQSKDSRGREWALPTPEQIEASCQELGDLLAWIKTELGIRDREIWRVMAWHQEAAYAAENSKASLGSVVLGLAAGSAGGGGGKGRLTWDSLHFSAIMQASYYSFRMLKQILGVVKAAKPDLPNSIKLLSIQLMSLPRLSELPGFYDDLESFSNPEERARYRHLERWFEDEEDEAEKLEQLRIKEENAQRKKERKAKRKRKEGDLAGKGPDEPGGEAKKEKGSVGTGGNMFALLEAS